MPDPAGRWPGCSSGGKHTKDSLETIKVNLAQKKAVLVDVREKRETDQGYIRDAVRLPLSQLQGNSAEPSFRDQVARKVSKQRIVYTYCRSGRRSVVAGELLKKMGYEVRPLRQGFQDLTDAGFKSQN